MGDGPLADAYDTGLRSAAPPVDAATGAALRFLTAAIGARSVVELGTGCGTSGIWLLRGMAPDGILTTVDVNAAYQDYARAAFARAGFGAGRARLIRGAALEVLPRLTDGGYDMVSVDADQASYPTYLDEALRLLRPGGVVVFNNVMVTSNEPDGPLRVPDQAEVAVREVMRRMREDEEFIPLLIPVGEGLLAAIRP
ncbi:O-methyltransferase [Nocardiopsis listeri]|uniref:O-methyltransferase n=1 Tax=Nocardiopsis listeri TaxID=53440 RepID=UPI0008328EE5|nr:class I SAM-dependent methyltransferase [Nocardiopsis listeri]